MKDDLPKVRGGRPQKFPGEGPRITHATRLRPVLAAKIAEAAERSHRSLGEEIEHRLDSSFGREEEIESLVNERVAQKTILMTALVAVVEAQRRVDATGSRYRTLVLSGTKDFEEFAKVGAGVEFLRKYRETGRKPPGWVIEMYGSDDYEILKSRLEVLERKISDLNLQGEEAAIHYRAAMSMLDMRQAEYAKTAGVSESYRNVKFSLVSPDDSESVL